MEKAKQPPDADSGKLEHQSIPLKSIEMQNMAAVPGNGVTVTGGIHSPVLQETSHILGRSQACNKIFHY